MREFRAVTGCCCASGTETLATTPSALHAQLTAASACFTIALNRPPRRHWAWPDRTAHDPFHVSAKPALVTPAVPLHNEATLAMALAEPDPGIQRARWIWQNCGSQKTLT